MANEEQELKDLKADVKFEKLIQMLEGDNVADFFGIDNKEIKHSNALGKLFNVRDYKSYWTIEFVKYFLDKSKIKLPKDFDYSSLRVKREYVLPPNNKIDIMLYSSVAGKETVILIENKFDATESEGQLAKYEDGIKAIPAFRNYKCYYIFLTKDGRAATSAKNNDLWKPVSYRVIIDMLEKVVKEIKSKLSEEMLNILNQYKQLLRRKMIMGKDIVLDKKCEDLCLSLVAKYPNAVNALLRFKDSKFIKANQAVSSEIERVLNDFQTKGIIEFLEVNGVDRGGKIFRFKSVNLKNRVNDDGKNPVVYTITLETSNPSNEATVQYYVCYGYYDKSVTDKPITDKILDIYGKPKISDRLLSQTENDAIEFIDVYDFEKECLLSNNVVEKTINDFLERARIEEDKY